VKRRKVWVNEYVGGVLSSFINSTKKQALGAIGSDGVAIPFVEVRRGDVVLSADQRRTLTAVVKWMDESTDGRFKVLVEPELRSLLRGGR
jgi:hypothetical protein